MTWSQVPQVLRSRHGPSSSRFWMCKLSKLEVQTVSLEGIDSFCLACAVCSYVFLNIIGPYLKVWSFHTKSRFPASLKPWGSSLVA